MNVYDLINFNPKNNTNDQPYQIGTVFHLRSELPGRPRNEARRSIFKYIEMFYNRNRIHSALGGLSPDQYEKFKYAA